MIVRLKTWWSPRVPNRRVLASWAYLSVTSIGGALTVAAAARLLPAADAGMWFTLQSLTSFTPLAEMGTQVSGARQFAHSFAAQAGADGEWISAPGMIQTRAGLAGVSDTMAALRYLRRFMYPLFVSLAVALGAIVYYSAAKAEVSTGIALLAWVFLSLAAMAQMEGYRYQSALDGVGRIDLERGTAAIAYALASIGVFFAMLLVGSITLMATVWAIGMVAALFAYRFALARWVGRLPRPEIDRRAGARGLLRVSSRIWLLNLGAIATRSAQVPAVSMLVGAASVPGYFLSFKMLNIVALVVAAVPQAERSLFTQDLAAGRKKEARTRMLRALIPQVVGAAATIIAFSLAGHWFITLWLRNPRAINYSTVYVMAFDTAISMVPGAVGQFVLASGRNPFVVSTLAAGIATVGLLFALVPHYGVLGAALAPLLAGLLTNYWYSLYQGFVLLRTLD